MSLKRPRVQFKEPAPVGTELKAPSQADKRYEMAQAVLQSVEDLPENPTKRRLREVVQQIETRKANEQKDTDIKRADSEVVEKLSMIVKLLEKNQAKPPPPAQAWREKKKWNEQLQRHTRWNNPHPKLPNPKTRQNEPNDGPDNRDLDNNPRTRQNGPRRTPKGHYTRPAEQPYTYSFDNRDIDNEAAQIESVLSVLEGEDQTAHILKLQLAQLNRLRRGRDETKH